MRRSERRLWLGPLLAVLGLAGYFGFVIQIGWRSMSDLPWLNLLLVAAGLTLSALAALDTWRASAVSWWKRALSVVGVGLSAFAAVALIGYVFFHSYQVPETAGVAPTGDPLPAVAPLLDERGAAFDLAEAAKGDVVLVFYRGFW